MTSSYVLGWLVTPIFLVTFAGAFLLFHAVFVATHWLFPRWYRRAVELGNLSLVLTLRIAGTRIHVKREPCHNPNSRPLIVVSNHQSLFDIPLIIWYLRDFTPHFIAKQELGRGMPALSHALRHMGSALIDRSNSQQALAAIQHLGTQLEIERGAAVIFPEGTRARDGSLKRFKFAGLRALLRAMPSALIVPVAIAGSWETMRWKMRPVPFGSRITLSVLPCIDPLGRSEDELLSQIESEIRQAVERLTIDPLCGSKQ